MANISSFFSFQENMDGFHHQLCAINCGYHEPVCPQHYWALTLIADAIQVSTF